MKIVNVPAITVRLTWQEERALFQLTAFQKDGWDHSDASPKSRASLVAKGLMEVGSVITWHGAPYPRHRLTLRGRVVKARIREMEMMTPIEQLAECAINNKESK